MTTPFFSAPERQFLNSWYFPLDEPVLDEAAPPPSAPPPKVWAIAGFTTTLDSAKIVAAVTSTTIDITFFVFIVLVNIYYYIRPAIQLSKFDYMLLS